MLRVRIFLAAFYVWAWILFQFNKFIGLIFERILKYTPNKLLPNVVPKIPIKILQAFDITNNTDITKKLNIFTNFKWDKEAADDKGGINIEPFAKYIESSIIWVAYALELDISENACNQFISMLETVEQKHLDFGDIHIKNNISYILIDISKKLIYKFAKNKLVKDDILFGEIDFH